MEFLAYIVDSFDFFRYGFIQRALLTGIFVGTASAVLGVFLVLRRYALIGHGLSHVAFGGVAVGLIFGNQPFWITLFITILSSIGILKLEKRVRMHADVAIGIVSAVGMAAGIIIASVVGGFNVDLMSYLFGSILAVGVGEFWASLFISILVLIFIFSFYHDLFALTFDGESAQAMGINVERYDYFFAVTTAVVVVVGMRVVGLLLVTALIILPAVTSLQVSKTFKGTILMAVVSVVFSVMLGVVLSYFLDFPTGGTIVLVNFFFFVCAFGVKKLVRG
jgi:zinc transport system permease protein